MVRALAQDMTMIVKQFTSRFDGFSKTSYLTYSDRKFTVHSITRFDSGNFIKSEKVPAADLISGVSATLADSRNP
jgi:hypothetical protein